MVVDPHSLVVELLSVVRVVYYLRKCWVLVLECGSLAAMCCLFTALVEKRFLISLVQHLHFVNICLLLSVYSLEILLSVKSSLSLHSFFPPLVDLHSLVGLPYSDAVITY